MRLDYDLTADALYIRLSDGAVKQSIEIDAETLVDLDADCNILGIEVITPDRRWPLVEILRRYSLPDETRQQLLAYFPPSKDPQVQVEPTAPVYA